MMVPSCGTMSTLAHSMQAQAKRSTSCESGPRKRSRYVGRLLTPCIHWVILGWFESFGGHRTNARGRFWLPGGVDAPHPKHFAGRVPVQLRTHTPAKKNLKFRKPKKTQETHANHVTLDLPAPTAQ